jgi:hypothetical protein
MKSTLPAVGCQLEVFMTQWRRIEALIPEPGPFIWRVSRTAMTPIALD